MNFVKNFLFFLTLFTTRKIVVFFDVDNPDFSLNIDQLNIYFIDWLLDKITFRKQVQNEKNDWEIILHYLYQKHENSVVLTVD